MVVKSWTNENTLEELTRSQRHQEVITGVIRSIRTMNLPITKDGSTVTKEVQTLIVALPGGVTGYCTEHEFRDFKIRSFNRFVGTQDSFVITKLDLEKKVAFLSGIIAQEILTKDLWAELLENQQNGILSEKEYDATVSGINTSKGVVHVRIQGQDAYMFRSEWSWNDREGIDAQIGETISVKITDIEPTEKLVRVSHRLTKQDPREFLNHLKRNDIIAGKIIQISPIHGIFVEVETGVVLKGTKPRALEEPDVGDLVSCRVERVDAENRRGRVVILNYPKGKRKKKDLGSFLFE